MKKYKNSSKWKVTILQSIKCWICYDSQNLFPSSLFYFERKTDLSDDDIAEILRSEDENGDRLGMLWQYINLWQYIASAMLWQYINCMYWTENIARVRNCPDIKILNSRFIHGHIHGLGLHLGISHGVGHGLGYVLVMCWSCLMGLLMRSVTFSHRSVQMSQKSQFVPKF